MVIIVVLKVLNLHFNSLKISYICISITIFSNMWHFSLFSRSSDATLCSRFVFAFGNKTNKSNFTCLFFGKKHMQLLTATCLAPAVKIVAFNVEDFFYSTHVVGKQDSLEQYRTVNPFKIWYNISCNKVFDMILLHFVDIKPVYSSRKFAFLFLLLSLINYST